MLVSVQAAEKCLLTIKPDLCERYVQAWRKDLTDWKRRAAEIPEMLTVEEALRELRLAPAQPAKNTTKIWPRPNETASTFVAGPVTIPRFDILKVMSECRVPAAVNQQSNEAVPAPESKEALVGTAASASDNHCWR
jgi:hypothetical protein